MFNYLEDLMFQHRINSWTKEGHTILNYEMKGIFFSSQFALNPQINDIQSISYHSCLFSIETGQMISFLPNSNIILFIFSLYLRLRSFISFSPLAKLDAMCLAHVIRNLRKGSFSTKSNKQLNLEDTRKTPLAPYRTTLLMMTQLFLKSVKVIKNHITSS